MKELINKGVTQKGLVVCLKICIPELLKSKSFEERCGSVFTFFDIDADESVSRDDIIRGFEVLYKWKPVEDRRKPIKSQETEPEPPAVIDINPPAEDVKDQPMNRLAFNFGQPQRPPATLPNPAYTPEKPEHFRTPLPQGTTPREDRPEDYTFSTEKLKRYTSPGYSPSYAPPQLSPRKSFEQVLGDVRMLAVKSGLKRVNAFEVVSKLKNLAYKERLLKYSTQSVFILEKYPIETGEVSYKNLGRGLIVLCGGTTQDKIDAAVLLYEKYGIQAVDSTEMADLCEGMFKLYEKFVPKSFERTSPEEIASSTASKCWEDLKIIDTTPIGQPQLKWWITEPILRQEVPEISMGLTKGKKEAELEESLELVLEKLLCNKELFNVINELKHKLGFEKVHVFNAIDFLLEENPHTVISRAKLSSCLKKLLPPSVECNPHLQEEAIARIMQTCDKERKGQAGGPEIMVCTSLICNGSIGDKLKAIARIFKIEEKGGFTFKELELCFHCVFELLFLPKQTALAYNFLEVPKLAHDTAKNCFKLSKKSLEDKVAYEEFIEWFKCKSA